MTTDAPPAPWRSRMDRLPVWLLGLGALVIVAGVLLALAFAGGRSLPEPAGPPIEEVAVERTTLRPGEIDLAVRNVGPDPITLTQVFVNDAFVDFEGGGQELDRLERERLRLDYPWQEGQPYAISILTSTGGVIEHEIPIAVETPESGSGLFGLMILLGTYVGIIPVVLGMLFLPAMRQMRSRWVRGLLALTVGLLLFLAVDASLEAVGLGGESGGAFGGIELLFVGAGLAYVALALADRLLGTRIEHAKQTGAGRWRMALLVAIGIGLHNLGEGLAIGSAYAIGALALGAALVVGFALHNTTEGVAIVAPLTDERPAPLRLLGLGLIAGAPAIAGALIGASINNAELTVFLLGVGVGAIARVAVQIWPSLRAGPGRPLDATALGGLAAGVLVMYLTGLLVAI